MKLHILRCIIAWLTGNLILGFASLTCVTHIEVIDHMCGRPVVSVLSLAGAMTILGLNTLLVFLSSLVSGILQDFWSHHSKLRHIPLACLLGCSFMTVFGAKLGLGLASYFPASSPLSASLIPEPNLLLTIYPFVIVAISSWPKAKM